MKTLSVASCVVVLVFVSCVTALAQGSMVSSATDGFSVPTAAVTGNGTITGGVFTVTKGEDRTGYSLTFGVSDDVDVFVNGVFGSFIDSDHERLGAKWRFTPDSVASLGIQLAAFCYDVRSGVDVKPGLVATWTGPAGLSLNAAGWYQDDRMTGGVSALCPIAEGINLSGEYSENDGLAVGFIGSYYNVSGLVYWLERYDDVFISANYIVISW